MAGNTFAANAFAQNFMTGFSFVDEIKRSKRAEKRLEERLKEERTERAFQKRRQQLSDKRVNTLFGQQQEDRVDALEEERLREEYPAFIAANPAASDAAIAKYAPYNPEAAAEQARRQRQGRIEGALGDVSTIGGQNQGTQTQSSQAQSPRSLSEAVTNQTGNEVDFELPAMSVAGTPAPAPAGFTESFEAGKDRSTAGLLELNEAQFEPFDRRRQSQGAIRQFGSTVAGDISQGVRGFGDAIMAFGRGPEGAISGLAGAQRESQPSAMKAEFSGNVFVPADEWTDEEEMGALGSEEERAAAFKRNEDIIDEYHDRGMNSKSGMTLGTTLGRTLEGSKMALKDAANADRRATALFSDFVNPNVQGTLEQMAVNDPIAATQLYMEMRATGLGAIPGAMTEVDKRMVPVVQAAAEQLGETAIQDPASTQGRISQNRLNRLQDSTNIVAKRQPMVADQAGVKGAGLKVGDSQRANDVLDVILDPNSPTVVTHTDSAAQAAATVVSNVTPNKRLNKRQIQGLATLVEAGYMNGDAAMSVMLTGSWPSNAPTIKDLKNFDGEIWATYNDGSVALLRAAKADPTKAGEGTPNLEINEPRMSQMEKGAATVFGELTPEQANRMRGLALHNPGWLRSTFAMDSEEHMMMAGRLFAQSIVLSAKELKSNEDNWTEAGRRAPTPEEIFLNKEIRTKLAEEHKVQLIAMPPVTANDGLDYEQVRIAARNGDYGPQFTGDNAQQLTKEALRYVYFVHNASAEQMQESNRRARAAESVFGE